MNITPMQTTQILSASFDLSRAEGAVEGLAISIEKSLGKEKPELAEIYARHLREIGESLSAINNKLTSLNAQILFHHD